MQTWVAFKSATNLLLPIKIQKAFEIFVTFVGKNQISFGLRQETSQLWQQPPTHIFPRFFDITAE